MKRLIFLVMLFIPAFSFADAGKVFRENSKSVVVVTAYNQKGEPLTEGTGFITGRDGIVVTNFHVISIASDVKVKAGGKVLNVEGVIHEDRKNDLIVLKVKGNNLPAVKFGDFNKAGMGEKVYIISSSDGRENVISDGTFKGIKEITHNGKALKIAAPVTHGSSGSPVFNERGEVIGIVTFLIRRTQNLILAMPSGIISEKTSGPEISKTDAIRAYKNMPERWFYLGYFLMEAGAHKDAIDVLKEAVRLQHGFAEAHYYLGVAYEESKMDTKAVGAYRKAVGADPAFSDAYFSLGMTYGRLGRYREAADALKEAVRLEPDYADARYYLCLTYLLLKDKASASEEFRALKEISPELANKVLKNM
ncbi:MAG: serine protease [Nitrospirae bacterium]|nr:serine protease [Nitrospirota bacterium]